jgi:hypothetical protein
LEESKTEENLIFGELRCVAPRLNDPKLINAHVGMDLTPDAINQVIHPTAAFYTYTPPTTLTPTDVDSHPLTWSESILNPKNRIDSLAPVAKPNWRIDGAAENGTQFYTVPLFTRSAIRIDTFIPALTQVPVQLQRALQLRTTFAARDERILTAGIAQHVLRTLEYFLAEDEDFRHEYLNAPWGSRIIFDNLAVNVKDIRVQIAKIYKLEKQLLSLGDLRSHLPDMGTASWPRNVDVGALKVEKLVHDSVSIASLREAHGDFDQRKSRVYAFKALTGTPKFMYHEVINLLSLRPHPNIIAIEFLVSKKCKWGAKVAVLGFLTPFHVPGTLRDILPLRRIQDTLRLEDQVKWSMQLTSAVIHIRQHGTYYSDLRLDNIVLTANNDIMLVDFEQRGVWCAFSAPEVNCLDYIHHIVMSEDEIIPTIVKSRYMELLDRYIPEWRDLNGDVYRKSEDGFAVPWVGLTDIERESAMVFMLGRTLWCIFEGVSAPEKAIWQIYPRESDLEFPAFRETAKKVRKIINECTKGRIERASKRDMPFIRRGSRIVLRYGDGSETPQMVQQAASAWWAQELRIAETWLESRQKRRERRINEDFYRRPKLADVLKSLQEFESAEFGG